MSANTYDLYKPGDYDEQLAATIAAKHGLTLEAPTLMLPYGSATRVGWETRRLYFALAVGDDGRLNRRPVIADVEANYKALPVTRIFSFGTCNVACPYCKRDCQFVTDDGTPIIAIPVPFADLFRMAEGAYTRGETVRFSGGDPVMFPRQTMAIAEYMSRRYGQKVSIAHNGSGTKWVERLLPHLSSAAIDLKAVPEKIGGIMGIDADKGPRMYARSLETQKLISGARVLLDVRGPVFGDTPTDDMRRLAHDICTTNDIRYTFWTWRMYKAVQGCDWVVPARDRVIEQMLEVSAEFPRLWMGMRAKWEKGGMLYVRGGQVVNSSADEVGLDVAEFGSGNLIPAFA